MGLSTHVLDTMHGAPAAGMAVALYETHGEVATLVKRFTLNADGRNADGPLRDNASLKAGTYRLAFDVAGYFRARGVQLPEPPFLNVVNLDFGIAHVDQRITTCRCCAAPGVIPPTAGLERADALNLFIRAPPRSILPSVSVSSCHWPLCATAKCR